MKRSAFYDVVRLKAKYMPPDETAMVYGDRRMSWAEFASRVNRLGNALAARGIKKGDKAAILFHNRPEFAESNLAIQALGAVPVPINYRYVADELEFVLDNCDAVCLIYEEECAEVVEQVRPKLNELHTWISTANEPADGILSYENLIGQYPDKTISTAIELDDVAVIIYTGGTTGWPKGVMLTYGNLLANQISVLNLMLSMLPKVEDIDSDNYAASELHRKILKFIGGMTDPMRPLLGDGADGRPVLTVQLTAKGMVDMPAISVNMIGDEVRVYSGAHPDPDFKITQDLGEDYRGMIDTAIYSATPKGQRALLPIMLKRLLTGQTRVKGGWKILKSALKNNGKAKESETVLINLMAAPPLFHLAAYAFWLTFITHQRGAVVFSTNHSFDPGEILDLIVKENIAWTLMVPAMWKKLVVHPSIGDYDLGGVNVCLTGAALLPAETKKKMLALFPNALVIDGFGQTEMAPVTAMKIDAAPEDVKDRSVGKVLAGLEMKVIDENGGEVPDGEVGELAYRGATLMKGYYGDEDATRRVVSDDGWFRSGDLAYRGPDGEIYTIERKGECINSGGEKIYPIEVEEIIAKHPKVDMVCVVGLPDEEWGQSVTAVVTSGKGEKPSETEIIEFCAGKMAGYKKPKRVIFVDELPLSPVGKMLRSQVREMAAERVSPDNL